MDDFWEKGEELIGKRGKGLHEAIVLPIGPSLLAFPSPSSICPHGAIYRNNTITLEVSKLLVANRYT